MKTGDIAFVKKFRIQDDPFRPLSIEPVTVTGKVVSVHYPSFTVHYDKPTPDGEEYQEFHVNHLRESVTVQDGNLTTILSVVLAMVIQAKQSTDSESLMQTLTRVEAICKEHMEI